MISEKAKNISPSITLEINAKVSKMKSEGEKIINLCIGEPDFFTPEKAKQGGIDAIKNNITKYDVASGNLTLKEEICKKLKEENNIKCSIENIVVSNAAKQAITNAFFAILNDGDEVLIPTPCWVSYPEIVKIAGGKPVFVKTDKKDDFLVSTEQIKKYLTNKTKAIILCNPSNPTGAVYDKKRLLDICDFAVKNHLIILADEIYERLTYDVEFTSVGELGEEIKNSTIIINGFSKSYSMTGWRLGYSVANSDITKAIASIQSHVTSHPSTISQQAGIYALKYCKDDYIKMREVYHERLKKIVDFFEKWNYLNIIKPNGAFYVFIDISPVKDKLSGDFKSVDFCNKILEQNKIALVPGAGFYEDDFVRMSYATNEEDIKKGLEGIKDFVEKL